MMVSARGGGIPEFGGALHANADNLWLRREELEEVLGSGFVASI